MILLVQCKFSGRAVVSGAVGYMQHELRAPGGYALKYTAGDRFPVQMLCDCFIPAFARKERVPAVVLDHTKRVEQAEFFDLIGKIADAFFRVVGRIRVFFCQIDKFGLNLLVARDAGVLLLQPLECIQSG